MGLLVVPPIPSTMGRHRGSGLCSGADRHVRDRANHGSGGLGGANTSWRPVGTPTPGAPQTRRMPRARGLPARSKTVPHNGSELPCVRRSLRWSRSLQAGISPSAPDRPAHPPVVPPGTRDGPPYCTVILIGPLRSTPAPSENSIASHRSYDPPSGMRILSDHTKF